MTKPAVLYVAQLIILFIVDKEIIHKTVNQSLDKLHAKKKLNAEAKLYKSVIFAGKPAYKVLKKLIIEIPIGKVQYFK